MGQSRGQGLIMCQENVQKARQSSMQETVGGMKRMCVINNNREGGSYVYIRNYSDGLTHGTGTGLDDHSNRFTILIQMPTQITVVLIKQSGHQPWQNQSILCVNVCLIIRLDFEIILICLLYIINLISPEFRSDDIYFQPVKLYS